MRTLLFLVFSLVAHSATLRELCLVITTVNDEQIRLTLAENELKNLIPIRDSPVTVQVGVAYAQGLLAAEGWLGAKESPPRIFDKPEHIKLYRAAELLHIVREGSNIPLTPEHFRWIEAYRATQAHQLGNLQGLDWSSVNKAERKPILQLLHALGLRPSVTGNRLYLAGSSDGDAITFTRARFLLESGANLDQLVEGLSDRIASKLTATDIGRMPFVYTRWTAHKVPGNFALRSVDTYMFTDPSKRVSVLVVSPRRLPLPGGGTREYPAETEVVRFTEKLDGEGMDLFERKDGKESSEPNGCIQCHRVQRGKFYSLTRPKPGMAFIHGDGRSLPGPNRSFFLSNQGLRSSGIAMPVMRPNLPAFLLEN